MRVYVYAMEDGSMDVLVEPSIGKGRSPVLLKAVTREDIVARVGPLVDKMRGPREIKQTRLL